MMSIRAVLGARSAVAAMSLASAVLTGAARPAQAQTQAAISVTAGANTIDRVVPGAKLSVPITLDMTAAAGAIVRSITSNFAWDPAVVTLDSLKPSLAGATSDITGAAAGGAALTVTGVTGIATSTPLATMYFTGTAPGGTRLVVTPTAASNIDGAIANGQLIGRGEDICIAPHALWGDADNDNAVTIIDAQQIARSTVGASVVDSVALRANGDVNGDGTVNILDAQAIARFAVELSAPARVGTDQGATPAVASLRVNHPTLALPLSQTTALLATPVDADGFNLVGCQPVTWSSSDPNTVRVNAVGKVTALTVGSATITAQSGTASVTSVITVTAPDATAALAHLRNVTAGGSTALDGIWLFGGLLTDEWKSSDTFAQRNNSDQRALADNDLLAANNVRELLRAISDARTVARNLTAAGGQSAVVGQMYFIEGYAELLLAENFCNGVPVTTTTNGLTVDGPPLTNATLFSRAAAHFDTALAFANGSDATSLLVTSDARIAKARALVEVGQYAAAAALLPNVPTSFQDLSTLASGESNKIWFLSNSARRYTVGDNVDQGGAIGNALNFASAGDVRVPVNGTSTGTSPAGKGFDQSTNFVAATAFTQTGATPLLSGLDARLIEAEAALNANNIAGMMAILNSLRASPPNLGTFTPAAMAALATPSTSSAAVDLLFRERAFWTFGRGQRLGDLRRLVRLYGRSQDTVFPAGPFFKGGTYGTAVNLPVPVDEDNNVFTLGCIDRRP